MDLSKVQLRCRCQLLMVLQLLLAISGSDHALQLMQRQQVLSAWDHKKAEGRQQEGHPTDPEKQPSVAPRRKPWALLVLVAPLRKPWALLVLGLAIGKHPKPLLSPTLGRTPRRWMVPTRARA
jgi:hypothetical protein